MVSMKRPESRHRPIAASVPSRAYASAEDDDGDEAGLCPKLESRSGLASRLRKCCSDTPSTERTG